MRGYAAIALENPKCAANVGGVLRAAMCYGAALVVIQGPRMRIGSIATDVLKTYRHIPVLEVDDVFDAIPHDCVPVAVEFIEGAKDLPKYRHPERAYYILGPEDGSVKKSTLDRCRDKVIVPTRFCMNLAATANVLLYDRLAKQA